MTARKISAMAVSVQRTTGDSPVARVTALGAVVAGREMARVVMAQTAARRRAAHWSTLIASSSMNETTNMTSATAVAPA